MKPDLLTGVGVVVFPFEEKLIGETKNYENKLRDYTLGMITDYCTAMDVGKGKAEHSDPTKVHPLTEFEKIGKESKKETDKAIRELQKKLDQPHGLHIPLVLVATKSVVG